MTLYDKPSVEQYGMLRGAMAGQTADATATAQAILAHRVGAEALIRAFNQGFVTLTFVFALSFVLIFMLKKAQPGAAAAGAH